MCYVFLCIKLACVYYYGTGMRRSEERALRWMRFSALQGLAEAQYDLGQMFQNGIGTAVDEAEAAKWIALSYESNRDALISELFKNFRPKIVDNVDDDVSVKSDTSSILREKLAALRQANERKKSLATISFVNPDDEVEDGLPLKIS